MSCRHHDEETPWVPDVQDGMTNINPEDVGLNAHPTLTVRYF